MVGGLVRRGLRRISRISAALANGSDGVSVSAEQHQVHLLNRLSLAHRYLKSSGIEIGALRGPVPVPPGCTVTYVDRMDDAELLRQYPEPNETPIVAVDVVDDGESLRSFETSSLDFIIANHFLEHTQDPIGTIKRHLEVLRPGGVLFMAVPDKRHTFDRNRPVTTLEHLYRDHEDGPARSYMDHVHEWVRLVENRQGDDFQSGVQYVLDAEYSIHFHVWTQNDLLAFFVDIRRRLALPFDILAVVENGNESLVVLQKWPDGLGQTA